MLGEIVSRFYRAARPVDSEKGRKKKKKNPTRWEEITAARSVIV